MSVSYQADQALVGPSRALGEQFWLRRNMAVEMLGPRERNRTGAVFDIDDCCLSSGFRTAAILEAYLDELTVDAHKEVACAGWALARAFQVPYRAEDFLSLVDPEEVRRLDTDTYLGWSQYWREHFFTNRFLLQDMPIQLILNALSHLNERLPVAYLTGRHKHHGRTGGPYDEGMETGTLNSLWRQGFPYGPVYFKPSFGVRDADFKRDYFLASLKPDSGLIIPVGYWDNAPDLVNLHDQVMTEHGLPHLSVWVDTVCSPADVELNPNVAVYKTR